MNSLSGNGKFLGSMLTIFSVTVGTVLLNGSIPKRETAVLTVVASDWKRSLVGNFPMID
jgi:hypothetical protein